MLQVVIKLLKKCVCTECGQSLPKSYEIEVHGKRFCSKGLDINEWFVSQDNKHDSIEEFVEAFNNTAPYKEKYLDMCVAGKEYEGKSGYTNYDMWLPKGSKDAYAFVAKGGRVLSYNEVDHLKKLEVKEVGSFGDDDLDIPKRASSDFSLD